MIWLSWNVYSVKVVKTDIGKIINQLLLPTTAKASGLAYFKFFKIRIDAVLDS